MLSFSIFVEYKYADKLVDINENWYEVEEVSLLFLSTPKIICIFVTLKFDIQK